MDLSRFAGTAPHRERWLLSYADLLTLLLAFFVVMYSVSRVDNNKLGKVRAAFTDRAVTNSAVIERAGDLPVPSLVKATSMTDAVSAQIPENETPGSRQESLPTTDAGEVGASALLTQWFADTSVVAGTSEDWLEIRIGSALLFDSGSAALADSTQLRFLLPVLQASTGEIQVEGHTDNVPVRKRKELRDNWQLSTERALSVLQYILKSNPNKYSPPKFSAAGYGEYHPVQPNDSEPNKALNRRVDIVVTYR
ncbi:MAG: flagellar motor protein MotB [Pseudomonadales bacterium]|nr:flagellar motor protein MotB [Pseudomonadales bacterium]